MGETATTIRDDVAERTLAARAREGDREAAGALIARLREAVRRVATAILADPHEGEDVAQEVGLSLLQNVSRWDGRTPPRVWVMRFCVNAARDRLRRRGARRRGWRRLIDRGDRRPPDLAPGRGPAAEASAREEAARVLEAVGRLPEAQRAAFSLCAVDGMSIAEAACALGSTRGAVKVNLFHARTRLRAWFGEGGER